MMDEKAIRLDERLACIQIFMDRLRDYAMRHPGGSQILLVAEEIAREIEARA